MCRDSSCICATGSPHAISSATTRSLHSLLQIDDFTEASFLLSVLGEGTFLDLLAFVERFAPDEATAELARRARIDEARHVHFGLAHVRHALSHDETLYTRLEAAVRRRAGTLAGIGEVPAPVQDALTIYAAGASDSRRVARGHEAFRELLVTMNEGRIRRLGSAGFTAELSATISSLLLSGGARARRQRSAPGSRRRRRHDTQQRDPRPRPRHRPEWPTPRRPGRRRRRGVEHVHRPDR